jgi:superfamily II DNA or RNA helicase
VAKLLLGRKHCQILDENDVEFIRELDRELSFFVQGAEYSAAFAGYVNKEGEHVNWDGRRHLLNESLQFTPGLLARVKKLYQTKGRPLEIVDTRPEPGVGQPIDIIAKLAAMGKRPYPYQLEAVEAALRHERGIIRIATGGGKTIVAALVTAALGKSTVIYVIGKDLLYQIHALFSSLFDVPIGIIGDGRCETADINVATVWSVGQALGLRKVKAEEEGEEKKVPPENYRAIKLAIAKARVHIFDECHLAACDTIQGIADVISPEHLYGMSASPWRDDQADLLIENHLGNKIIDISARTLIDGGYLVPPTIRFLSVEPWTGRKKTPYPTVYSKYVVENPVRNAMVAKGAEKLVEQGYQTLVLFHNLKHGQILFESISRKLSCALLSGKDSSDVRQEVKEKLELGKINCVIASKIFDIGVDLPSLSGLVVAGAGKSSVRALQRIGRVIRKHPSKTRAAVIEFADQAPYLLNHAGTRRQIYQTEEFDVQWPGEKRA